MEDGVFVYVALGAVFVILLAGGGLTFFIRSNYQRALSEIKEGRMDQALPLLSRVVAWQNSHVPALWQIALVYIQDDRHLDASRYLRRIMQILDDHPQKEVVLMEMAIAESQILSSYAWSLTRSGQNSDAIDAFDRLLALDPDDSGSRFELARLHYDARNLKPAIENLKTVVQKDPGNLDAYDLLAQAMIDADLRSDAAAVMRARLSRDTHNIAGWVKLARLLRSLGEHEAVFETWKTVELSANPDDPNRILAALEQGKLARELKYLDVAVNHFERAVGQCPANNPNALKEIKYQQGLIFVEMERQQDAMRCFGEVYKIDPVYQDVKIQLRNAMELLDDVDLTNEFMNMPADSFAKIAEDMVRQIGLTVDRVEQMKNKQELKIHAKLEVEDGKNKNALVQFQRDNSYEVGELTLRTFMTECDEHGYDRALSAFFSLSNFSFDAKVKAKDSKTKLYPNREFCAVFRKSKKLSPKSAAPVS